MKGILSVNGSDSKYIFQVWMMSNNHDLLTNDILNVNCIRFCYLK